MMKLKARVKEPGTANQIKDRVRFTVEDIGTVTPIWAPDNPNGKPIVNGDYLEATVAFDQLPLNNSDFGAKKAAVYLDDIKQDEASYEVFFPKYALNHPGGIATDPNWFYYWKDGGVCGIDSTVLYDPSIEYGKYNYGQVVYLGYGAASTNSGIHTYVNRFNGATLQATGNGKGIKCVAEIVVHEKQHKYVYEQLSGTDNDKDCIPDAMESYYLGISTATNGLDCCDTFNLEGFFNCPRGDPDSYYLYGDEEVRCRLVELNVLYNTTNDWANPGCQSKNRVGP